MKSFRVIISANSTGLLIGTYQTRGLVQCRQMTATWYLDNRTSRLRGTNRYPCTKIYIKNSMNTKNNKNNTNKNMNKNN